MFQPVGVAPVLRRCCGGRRAVGCPVCPAHMPAQRAHAVLRACGVSVAMHVLHARVICE